jgi:hypothetical protein
LAVVKPKDYDFNGDVEAATPYAAWKQLAESPHELRTGDLLEILTAEGTPAGLLITKYIGFEPATWWVPEPKPESAVGLEADGMATHGSTRETSSTSALAHS